MKRLAKLQGAAKRFENATDALRDAAFEYAKEQVLLLSRRLPSRQIEYLCGNGTTLITVSKRNGGRNYQLSSGGFTGTEQRICARLASSLEFEAVLDRMESDYRIFDIGSGIVIARNGVEVTE